MDGHVLIYADTLIKEIEKAQCTGCNSYNGVKCRACWVDDAIGYIDSAPVVNAVVLPCNVGDTVWWMTGCKILKCYVARFQIAEYGVAMLLRTGKTRCGLFPVNLIGTSLFFSEENANDALAERRAEG